MTAQANWQEIEFTDADVVNPHDYDSAPSTGDARPWLIHDAGFVLAVVFASNLEEAFELAADAGKLDTWRLTREEFDALPQAHQDNIPFLGNEGWPYDIDSVMVEELPNPRFSFVALFNAMKKEK